MNTDLTEIVLIADRSGSMDKLLDETVGGLNNFVQTQKNLPGQANFTLVTFDDMYERPIDRKSIQDVPEITQAMVMPRGMTALLDAIGRTITYIGEQLANTPEENRPSKIIFGILTDGQENASKEFVPTTQEIVSGVKKSQKIFDMITHQREKYNWEFVFLAANQDAFETSAGLGISGQATANFDATKAGATMAYACLDSSIKSYRTKGAVDMKAN